VNMDFCEVCWTSLEEGKNHSSVIPWLCILKGHSQLLIEERGKDVMIAGGS